MLVYAVAGPVKVQKVQGMTSLTNQDYPSQDDARSKSPIFFDTASAPSCLFRSSLVLISETRPVRSTSTPSFSGCPSGKPISLTRTLPAASSSSPKMTANGTSPDSAALNCCGSLGLTLCENSAYSDIVNRGMIRT